jgi:purine-nucleoside phosphorylase
MKEIGEAVAYVKKVCDLQPDVGVVLGSGMGSFVKEIDVIREIPYTEIPHFPVSTVEGHSGKLVLGNLNGKKVVVMAGRFHFYEGYTAQQVTFPIRVMKMLGIHTLLLSNAAGGVNPSFKVGDLMIITDHISQLIPNPLIGRNLSELGPRFPDMSEPYNKILIGKMKAIAAEEKIPVREGVYVAVTGPTFETKAEYAMIHALGGDAVGMSTVQETITAVQMGLPVFAMSVITDMWVRGEDNTVSHEEVLAAAKASEPGFIALFRKLVAQL